MQEFARAKINLSLRVCGRRPDGYHELESLVVFADAADRLSVAAAKDISLSLSGPFASELSADPENLALRAARALRDFAGVTAGATLTLEKNLPIASGIGGGSADAAATFRLLCRLWKLQIDEDELPRLALRLGADVPVCLRSQSAFMQGVGEDLVQVSDLPHLFMLLVNPGVAVSTTEIFRLLQAPPLHEKNRTSAPPSLNTLEALVRWLDQNPNDLEKPALALAPVIGPVLEAIGTSPGCRLARMSGSGATCFGLFAKADAAQHAAAMLRQAHPGWWVALSGCG